MVLWVLRANEITLRLESTGFFYILDWLGAGSRKARSSAADVGANGCCAGSRSPKPFRRNWELCCPTPRLSPFPVGAVFHRSKYYYEYPIAPIRATIVRFYMTTHTTLSAAGWSRPARHSGQAAPHWRLHSPPATRHSLALWRRIPDEGLLATEFLIANARLEFPATARKQSVRPESNRKRIAISSCAPQPRRPLAGTFLMYCGAIRIPRKPLKT
jgi:hypothetical protein